MLVNTEVVLDTLSAMPAIGEYQVVFTRGEGAMDRLVIRIERDGDPADRAALAETVAQKVRMAVSLRPDVEFVARGALYDHERSVKAKRVVDLRERTD
jgi:phenylacetate-coenzyme A ligase PaaK-like adenylate-forming protein